MQPAEINTPNLTDLAPLLISPWCNSTDCNFNATGCATTDPQSKRSEGLPIAAFNLRLSPRQDGEPYPLCHRALYHNGKLVIFFKQQFNAHKILLRSCRRSGVRLLRHNMIADLANITASDFGTRYRNETRRWFVRTRFPLPDAGEHVNLHQVITPVGENLQPAPAPVHIYRPGGNPYQVGYLISPNVLLHFADTTVCWQPDPQRERTERGDPVNWAGRLSRSLRGRVRTDPFEMPKAKVILTKNRL